MNATKPLVSVDRKWGLRTREAKQVKENSEEKVHKQQTPKPRLAQSLVFFRAVAKCFIAVRKT
jgi:hypothetical protein